MTIGVGLKMMAHARLKKVANLNDEFRLFWREDKT